MTQGTEGGERLTAAAHDNDAGSHGVVVCVRIEKGMGYQKARERTGRAMGGRMKNGRMKEEEDDEKMRLANGV